MHHSTFQGVIDRFLLVVPEKVKVLIISYVDDSAVNKRTLLYLFSHRYSSLIKENICASEEEEIASFLIKGDQIDDKQYDVSVEDKSEYSKGGESDRFLCSGLRSKEPTKFNIEKIELNPFSRESQFLLRESKVNKREKKLSSKENFLSLRESAVRRREEQLDLQQKELDAIKLKLSRLSLDVSAKEILLKKDKIKWENGLKFKKFILGRDFKMQEKAKKTIQELAESSTSKIMPRKVSSIDQDRSKNWSRNILQLVSEKNFCPMHELDAREEKWKGRQYLRKLNDIEAAINNNRCLISTLTYLAGCHRCLNQWDDAISAFKEILRIKKVTLGEKHYDVASTLNNSLGDLYMECGIYDMAINTFREAALIFRLNGWTEEEESSLYKLEMAERNIPRKP